MIPQNFATTTDGQIRTVTGKFHLLKPTVSSITVENIAKGLAYNPHFCGQTPYFFSIAQHSVMVKNLFTYVYRYDDDKKLIMAGTLVCLLHDASEAFTGDISKPLKNILGRNFEEIEDRITDRIMEKFNLSTWYYENYHKIIKPFDIEVQKEEYKMFFDTPKNLIKSSDYWTPDRAYKKFRDELNLAIKNYNAL